MGISREPAVRVRGAVLVLAVLKAVAAAGGAVALATGANDLGRRTHDFPFDSPVFGGIALFVVGVVQMALGRPRTARSLPVGPTTGGRAALSQLGRRR